MSQVDQNAVVADEPQGGEQTSFRGLFNRESHSLVTIPIIQRDFAQGRDGETEIRNLFLDSIADALATNKNLDLDFVYGSIEGDKTKSFCPLDGQQRLTTLFLLHWYLAWANGKFEDFQAFISADGKSRFTYAVRPSSGEFFDELVRWHPNASQADVPSLRELIEDQSWFYRWWMRDPTIQSALTMLETIHGRIEPKDGLYDRLVDLESPAITFQLLPLKDFGLSDDLYIKMNARGKPLTSFEVFKARLENTIKELMPNADRELNGEQVTSQEYFSQKIDDEWAEFFWKCRGKGSQLFDNEVMNLIGALALITRDPGNENFDESLEELREFGKASSFHFFDSAGCLDIDHIEGLIDLLDLVTAGGSYNKYLPEPDFYDEERVFRGILREGRRTSYPLLIQFFAYLKFLQTHGVDCDQTRFFDWMRIVVNLTENSNIERPEQFKSSLASVASLIDFSGDILTHIAEDDTYITPFSRQQIREERIKARLINKSGGWNNAVLAAEKHRYFNGQIEFLLDFSGILDSWNEDSSLTWNGETSQQFLDSFTGYRDKAAQLFEGSRLKNWGDFRTERALLTFGNYMLARGQNSSFLEDADSPISWKRLLRGEQLDDPGVKRGCFKELLDNIDLKEGVAKSLDKAIGENKAGTAWRQVLVNDPRLIAYCQKRKIRWIHETDVYLLRGERRSGQHADLFSYNLYLNFVKPRTEQGKLQPFVSSHYEFVHTDAYQPWFQLATNDPIFTLRAWNMGNKYCLRLVTNNAKVIAECQKELGGVEGFEIDKEGVIGVGTSAVIEAIDKVANAVVKFKGR